MFLKSTFNSAPFFWNYVSLSWCCILKASFHQRLLTGVGECEKYPFQLQSGKSCHLNEYQLNQKMYLIKKNVSVDLKRSTLGRPLQPVLLVSAGGGQLNATLSTTCATYLKCKQHKHPNCDHYSSSVEERKKHTADSCVYAVTVEWVHESYT